MDQERNTKQKDKGNKESWEYKKRLRVGLRLMENGSDGNGPKS